VKHEVDNENCAGCLHVFAGAGLGVTTFYLVLG